LEDVIPESHIPDGGHNKSEHVIKHHTGTHGPNGQPVFSEIHYHGLGSSGAGSTDGLPRKVSGMQFSTIGIDEATETSEAQYTQLLGRLRYDGKVVGNKKYKIPFRQIITATNPAGPNHYLYRKFFDKGVGSKYHLKPHDNPGLPDDYVQQLEDNYSGVFYERYVEGKWVGTESVVYDEFDHRKHELSLTQLETIGFEKSDLFPNMIVPPESWEVYRGIDFGYPSPMSVQWWARPGPSERGEDQVGPLVMFREFYQSGTLVEDIADSIRKWSKDVTVEQTFADPAQAQDRETLSRHDVSSTEAKKDVWNGIQSVKSLLGKEFDQYGDMPGVVFFDESLITDPDEDLADDNKPTRVIEEIGSYEWKNGTDEPIKRDDHGCDTMRYVVYTLDERSRSALTTSELEDMEAMFNSGF
jgi:phage terminase large subunit